MPLETTELASLGAIVAVVPFLVQHVKPLLRVVPAFRGDDAPWALVADVSAVLLALWAFYAGVLPSMSNPLEAALAGFLAAIVGQRGYDVVKAPPRVHLSRGGNVEPSEEPLPNLLVRE